MAHHNGPVKNRPSNAEILAAIEAHGSVAAAAKALGFPTTTFGGWAKIARGAGGGTTIEVTDAKELDNLMRENGFDPKAWYAERVTLNKWGVDGAEQRQIKAHLRRNPADLLPDDKGWKRPKIKPHDPTKPYLTVICGDPHPPKHDLELHARFLSWLKKNKPAKGVILGDILENADVSQWKDRPGQPTAKESVQAAYYMIRDYIAASPNTDWTVISGNHDERIEDYQRANAPKTAGICRGGEDVPVMSVPYLLKFKELGITYIADYPIGKLILAPNLAVAHGNIVKKGAGASALANLDKRGYAIITGHTHRLALVFKTTLGIDDLPHTLYAAETGTMKKIEPELYDVSPDSQNGFVTATIWPDGDYHLEQAVYSNGHLRWRGQRF